MRFKEEWKPVKGFEGRYFISNTGRLKTVNCFGEKIMKTRLHKNGYERVQLYNGKKFIDKTIHRLVAEAFVPNPDNKPYIDHLDGNKQNNLWTNLEFVTMAENNQRAYDTGLKRRIHAGQWIKGSNTVRRTK